MVKRGRFVHRAQKSADRIRVLEAQKVGMKADQGQQSEQGRAALNPRLTEAENKVARIANERSTIVAQRAVLVRKMVEADPAFIPKSNGLIARVQALDAVQTGSFSAMLLSVAMTIMFSLMELAVLLLRVINGTPHIVGAEKVNLNINSLEQIFAARRLKARRSRSVPANDIGVTHNDDVDRGDRSDASIGLLNGIRRSNPAARRIPSRCGGLTKTRNFADIFAFCKIGWQRG